MRASKVNEEWHDVNRMPRNPTRTQRAEWHVGHVAACGCRPVPPSLVAEVKALGRKQAGRTN